jgi:hypothetical protein
MPKHAIRKRCTNDDLFPAIPESKQTRQQSKKHYSRFQRARYLKEHKQNIIFASLSVKVPLG